MFDLTAPRASRNATVVISIEELRPIGATCRGRALLYGRARGDAHRAVAAKRQREGRTAA